MGKVSPWPSWRRVGDAAAGGGLAVSHKIESSRRAKKEKSASARVEGEGGNDDEGGRISK